MNDAQVCSCLPFGVSSRVHLAVLAMLEVALSGDVRLAQSKDIARRRRIAIWRLDAVLLKLRIAGLVRSTRGPKGGYALAMPAANISLAAIASAMESPGKI